MMTEESGKNKLIGSPSSVVWAALVALVIGGWLLSGQLRSTDNNADPAPANKPIDDASRNADQNQSAKPRFQVKTRVITAERRQAELVIRGQTMAMTRVHVRAETSGVVKQISDDKGLLVDQGALLCKISVDARNASLLEAKAALVQAEADLKSSRTLAEKGHTGALKVVADKARLDSAKAAYERARLDLEHISIKAPFRGVIEDQPARVGDYLRQTDVCATLVQLDPILLTGAVSERDITHLKLGAVVNGTLITGEKVSGKLTFISPSSDTGTKTFRIEVEVANTNLKIRGGITTDLSIPLATEPAHRISPAVLTLNDAGEIGVRIVNSENIVQFKPVEIVSNERNAVWIKGLPQSTRIITLGQEYVTDGQQVDAVEETEQSRATKKTRLKTATTSVGQ